MAMVENNFGLLGYSKTRHLGGTGCDEASSGRQGEPSVCSAGLMLGKEKVEWVGRS